MRGLLAAVAVAAAGLLAPAPASAHGDAASHYLETQSLYPSFANRPSQATELQLLGLLQAAARDGYPVKVALVGATEDVPEHPEMLRRPQRYAEFVARVLPGRRVPVLVVTPSGLGVAGGPLRAAGLGSPPAARDGDALATTAMKAVRRLARAGGHPLPASVAPAQVLTSSSGSRGGGLDLGWISLGIFLTVIALAALAYEARARHHNLARSH